MSANCRMTFTSADWFAAPLALAPPRGFRASLAALGSAAAPVLKARQILEALRRPSPRGPGGGGAPDRPDDATASDGIWNDPSFWMLMMH
jgi:hypothetical protein